MVWPVETGSRLMDRSEGSIFRFFCVCEDTGGVQMVGAGRQQTRSAQGFKPQRHEERGEETGKTGKRETEKSLTEKYLFDFYAKRRRKVPQLFHHFSVSDSSVCSRLPVTKEICAVRGCLRHSSTRARRDRICDEWISNKHQRNTAENAKNAKGRGELHESLRSEADELGQTNCGNEGDRATVIV